MANIIKGISQKEAACHATEESRNKKVKVTTKQSRPFHTVQSCEKLVSLLVSVLYLPYKVRKTHHSLWVDARD